MKIRPEGVKLFYEEGRTDMTKLTVAFRSFVKTPKMTNVVILSTPPNCGVNCRNIAHT